MITLIGIVAYFLAGWFFARQKERKTENIKTGETEIKIIPRWLRVLFFFFWPLSLALGLIIIAICLIIIAIIFLFGTSSLIGRWLKKRRIEKKYEAQFDFLRHGKINVGEKEIFTTFVLDRDFSKGSYKGGVHVADWRDFSGIPQKGDFHASGLCKGCPDFDDCYLRERENEFANDLSKEPDGKIIDLDPSQYSVEAVDSSEPERELVNKGGEK